MWLNSFMEALTPAMMLGIVVGFFGGIWFAGGIYYCVLFRKERDRYNIPESPPPVYFLVFLFAIVVIVFFIIFLAGIF